MFCIVGAQNQKVVDSLETIIQSKASEEIRLKAYLDIAKTLNSNDSELLEKYINDGIVLSQKVKNEKARLLLTSYKGDILISKSPANAEKARVIYKEVLAISQQQKLDEVSIKMYIKIAFSYYLERNFNAAIANYLEGHKMYERFSNKNSIDFPYKLLAGLYWQQKNFKQAHFFTEKRMEDNTSNDPLITADCYVMKGIIYADNGNKEKGLEYFKKSVVVFKELGIKQPQARILFNIGTAYFQSSNFNAALDNYHSSRKLYEELKDTVKVIENKSFIGLAHLNLQQEDSAFYYIDQVFDYYKEKGKVNALIFEYQKVGEWYFLQGKLTKTLQLYYDALKSAEELKNKAQVANMYRLIGNVHKSQDNFEQAINYHEQALENYGVLKDSSNVAKTKNDISELFIKTNQYQKALSYSTKALQQFQSFQDSCQIRESQLIIGKAYLGLQKLDSATNYLNKVLPKSSICNLPELITEAYIALGQVYISQNQESTAVTNFEKALTSANATNDRQGIKEATKYLYPIYQRKGNYQKAFETLELYQASKDSLFDADNTRTLIQKELEYEYEKQKQEEVFLQQQNELKQQQVVERQRWIIYIVILMSLALIAIVFSLYRNSANKKKANELLNQQNLEIAKQKAALEELDVSKSRLYANISHELRTPLTLISSPIQYMLSNEKNQFDANQIQQLELVKRNTKQLKGLVDDILALSKLESNKLELYEETLDINAFVSRSVSNYHSLAKHLGITYEFKSEIPEETYVLLDREKVEKIINNLISNAMKHTPSSGYVTFLAAVDNDILHIQVTDSGFGIPEEDLPHIFDRFFQSKNADNTLQGGTGIGLALVKELVQLMNGKITVSSEVGKGSIFSLYLPFKEIGSSKVEETAAFFAEEVEDLPDTNEHFTKNTQQYNLLIVEDHPDMQRFIQQLLNPKYNVYTANNGKQALEVLKKTTIDLIVSDVMMPEMDGQALLKALKNHESYYAIPVIMLTALSNDDSKLEALMLGVDDYLSKPFSPEELMARVHNLLERYTVRQMVAKEIEAAIQSETSEHQFETTTVKQTDAEWLKEVEKSIQKELENIDFNIGSLADQFFLSSRQFQRKIKKITGLTPKKFQQEVALQEARKLLENQTYKNVKAIAFTIGMSNVWRFSQLYEHRFGKKPSEYFT
ncbi:sensor histidine kinase TodS [Kordia sp. SMS9]|nr:sensor histidine kinase TodS [Kordia sp. SMS9]